MYWKHKIYSYFFGLMLASVNLYSWSLSTNISKLFSFGLPEDLLASVNKEIVGTLGAKNIRFFLPNKIEMDNVEVLDEFGDRVLYAKHVKLAISLVSLLTNNIIISEAQIESPFFRYSIKKNLHNIIRVFDDRPGPSQHPPTKSKLRVSIAHVRVNNGSYEMEHDVGLKIFAQGIQAAGKFWVEKGPFEIDISRASISRGGIILAGMDLPISDLVAQKLFISDQKVSSTSLTAFYEKAALSVSGTVFIDEDRYQVTAQLNAPPNTYPQGLAKLPFTMPSFLAAVNMVGALVEPEFEVDATLGATAWQGLVIKQAKILANINFHQLVLKSSAINIGDDGLILADGLIDIDNKRFSVNSTEKNILVDDFLKLAGLELANRGRINANTSFEGSLSSTNTPLLISAKGHAADLELDQVLFASVSNFDAKIELYLGKSINIKNINISDNQGLLISGHADIDLKAREYSFIYNASIAKLDFYIPKLLNKLKVRNYKSAGQIAWRDYRWYFSEENRAQTVAYEKSKIGPIKAVVNLVNNELVISNISANFYHGSLNGELKMKNWRTDREISGQIAMSSVDIFALSRAMTDTNLRGSVNAVLKLSGNLSRPVVNFLVEAQSLVIDRLEVLNTQFNGSYHDAHIDISHWLSEARSGSLEGVDLSFDSKTKVLGGAFYLADLSMASFLYKYLDQADGSISGNIILGGTTTSPKIIAPLIARNLIFKGQKFGSGSLTLELKKDQLLAGNQESDLIFSISAALREQSGLSKVRFALALSRQTINVIGEFSELPFDTNNILVNQLIAMRGLLSGSILASGLLASPKLKANFTAHEYSFFDQSRLNDKMWVPKKYGPARLDLSIDNAHLNLDLCTSFSKQILPDVCSRQNGLTLSLTGPFSYSAFSLDLSGTIYHDHLEDIITPFKNELLTLGMIARIDGKINKKFDRAMTLSSKVYLDRFIASLPNIPQIKLKEPITVDMSHDQIVLNKDAVLLFNQGQLILNGQLARAGLDIKLGGSIPLVLAKFLVPMIKRADGLATGQLAIAGPIDALIAEGYISPVPGANISFKKWFEMMEIKEGRIAFIKHSPHSFVSKFENIRLAIGDGRMSIDGNFLKNYQSNNSKEFSTFDMQIEGSNIILRDRHDFVEADFKFSTLKKGHGPSVLSGKIVITDGSAHRQFDLRNFVAQLADNSQEIQLKWLEQLDMNIDFDVLVRQFKASMRMINIDVDTILNGQLFAIGPLNKPKFNGSLVVSEGTIKFPSTTFDLIESRIDLDELSDRIFDPKIMIVSSQELEKDTYPQLSQDTTVELSFKGSLDRMSFDLKPLSGDLRLSPTRIFLLLLVPRGFGDDANNNQVASLRKGAQNAAMAFSGELFLRPLTNELQELLEGQTKTRIQFGSALEAGRVTLRLNWKIGQRIELTSSYMFMSEDARTLESDKSSFFYDSYPLGDLKIKLLILDHKPFGPLFLESAFGANQHIEGNLEPRGKIRLTYRVLSR